MRRRVHGNGGGGAGCPVGAKAPFPFRCTKRAPEPVGSEARLFFIGSREGLPEDNEKVVVALAAVRRDRDDGPAALEHLVELVFVGSVGFNDQR